MLVHLEPFVFKLFLRVERSCKEKSAQQSEQSCKSLQKSLCITCKRKNSMDHRYCDKGVSQRFMDLSKVLIDYFVFGQSSEKFSEKQKPNY